ncbi:unnamed protein product [Allacma fusca]|uniref:Magnesium transporter n=1 Tax=Allacma fusca TaxID=39272 RepID=A0A8J2KZ83_9HEXA|nr:unnamed protein product [Allacma fusca]
MNETLLTTLKPVVTTPILLVPKRDVVGFWIGVGLSVASSIFIGASFIIKKKALLRLRGEGKPANQGGYGYLKDVGWWAGLLSMALGEALNFVAYAFAPASIVSLLGVLSVLVTTILSSKYLNERLNFFGKIGCFLCAIGTAVIILHAPQEKEIENMRDLQAKISQPAFILYVNIVAATSVILVYFFRVKYAEESTKTLLIWLGVCAMVGSLSVMSVKGVGLAFTVTLGGGRNEFTNWLTYFCIVTLVMCVAIQMNFLNKALDTFNTAVVTPIYYVMFTTCVIIASAILFREFSYLSVSDWTGLICGFLNVLTAIFILNFCKNYDFSLNDLTHNFNAVLKPDVEKDESELTIMPLGNSGGYGTQTEV